MSAVNVFVTARSEDLVDIIARDYNPDSPSSNASSRLVFDLRCLWPPRQRLSPNGQTGGFTLKAMQSGPRCLV